jgi:hypothetical protein
LRVGRISKDKSDMGKLQKSYRTERNVLFERAEKEMRETHLNRYIVKPFQFYLLDPGNYEWTGGDHESGSLWSEHDPDSRDTRYVFFNLLSRVRHCVFMANLSTQTVALARDYIETLEVRVNSRLFQYQVLKTVNHVDGNFQQVRQKEIEVIQTAAYDLMKKPCQKAFKEGRVRGSKTSFSTHDLRRLYVCYSYEVFAKDKMKEIGYAAKVLMHDSYEASLAYTTFKIVPMLGGRLSKKVLDQLDVTVEMSKILEQFRQDIKQITDESLDAYRHAVYGIREDEDHMSAVSESDNDESSRDERQPKRQKNVDTRIFIVMKSKDGKHVPIEKLVSLTGHKVEKKELGERARKKIREMVTKGIVSASKRELGRIGINTTLHKEMSAYMSQYVDVFFSEKEEEESY